MQILIVLLSIYIITSIVWAVRWGMKLNICPICAGISLTWIGIVGALYFGLLPIEPWRLVAGILAGGSVVGFAYQIEKILSKTLVFPWKVLFIPIGFLTVYFLINFLWNWFVISGILTSIILFYFTISAKNNGNNSDRAKNLEEKMKDCC